VVVTEISLITSKLLTRQDLPDFCSKGCLIPLCFFTYFAEQSFTNSRY